MSDDRSKNEAATPETGREPAKGRSRALLIPLLIYTFFLFLGSIPEPMRFTEGLDSAVKAVRKGFFKYAHAKPGLGVFHGGRKHNVVDRNLCVVVVGVDKNGELTRLYETFPSCEYPTVRVFNDTYNLVLSQQIRVGRLESLASFSGKPLENVIKRARAWPPIDGIAKLYCERSDSSLVFVSAFTTASTYNKNKPVVRNRVLRGLNCAQRRRVPVSLLKATVQDGRPSFELNRGRP